MIIEARKIADMDNIPSSSINGSEYILVQQGPTTSNIKVDDLEGYLFGQFGPSMIIDIDPTFSGSSDIKVPSQKAVKTAIDIEVASRNAAINAAVTGLVDLKGVIDCSTNPNYPSASKGDGYKVSVAGKIGGISGSTVQIGDFLTAIDDSASGSQASVGSNWFIVQANLIPDVDYVTPNYVLSSSQAKANLEGGNIFTGTQEIATSDASAPVVINRIGPGSLITLDNGIYTASIGYSPLSYEALTLTIDALNLNVLTLKNTNTGNAFSAMAFEGSDNIEHGAIGIGAPGSAGAFANAMYIESSHYPTSGSNTPYPMRFVQTGYVNGMNQTRKMAEFTNNGAFVLYNYSDSVGAVWAPDVNRVGINTTTTPAQPLDVLGTAIIGGSTGTSGRTLENGGGFALHVLTPQTTSNAGNTAGNVMRLVRDLVVKCDITITGTGATRAINFVDSDNSSVVPLSISLNGTGVVTTQAQALGQQSLSGSGEANVTTGTTLLTTTGTNVITLSNGVTGQRKTIIHVVAGGTGTLTPTTKTGFTNIVFSTVGDSATLEYVTTLGWMVVSVHGATVTP